MLQVNSNSCITWKQDMVETWAPLYHLGLRGVSADQAPSMAFAQLSAQLSAYPPVNVYITLERSTMLFMGKSTISTGPFSIAFCMFASSRNQVVRFFDIMDEANVGRVGFTEFHNFVEAAVQVEPRAS